jgi:hypothetical protein
MPSSSTCLDEDILQTLHNDYKSNFNEDEWNKICRFECQFQRKYSEVFDFEETSMTLYNSNVEHIGVLLFPHRILQIS